MILQPKVIFLDVNETLLDLEPLNKSVAKALGGNTEVARRWFTSLLHFSLVATLSDRYQNFAEIGMEALQMLADEMGISLSESAAKAAIEPILTLPPHADVEPALNALLESDIDVFTLTNSSTEGVRRQMHNAGLESYLKGSLSVETLRAFKPDPRVYRWAAKTAGVSTEDCMLIAAHGWDISGAMAVGMRGCFLSRPGAHLYPRSAQPELIKPTLDSAVNTILSLPD